MIIFCVHNSPDRLQLTIHYIILLNVQIKMIVFLHFFNLLFSDVTPKHENWHSSFRISSQSSVGQSLFVRAIESHFPKSTKMINHIWVKKKQTLWPHNEQNWFLNWFESSFGVSVTVATFPPEEIKLPLISLSGYRDLIFAATFSEFSENVKCHSPYK